MASSGRARQHAQWSKDGDSQSSSESYTLFPAETKDVEVVYVEEAF